MDTNMYIAKDKLNFQMSVYIIDKMKYITYIAYMKYMGIIYLSVLDQGEQAMQRCQ